MIKEIVLSTTVRTKSWRYWVNCDELHHTYEAWIQDEYKIKVIRSMTSFSSYQEFLIGDEKDLTYFLLRWS